jgi:hypothetical protein
VPGPGAGRLVGPGPGHLGLADHHRRRPGLGGTGKRGQQLHLVAGTSATQPAIAVYPVIPATVAAATSVRTTAAGWIPALRRPAIRHLRQQVKRVSAPLSNRRPCPAAGGLIGIVLPPPYVYCRKSIGLYAVPSGVVSMPVLIPRVRDRRRISAASTGGGDL